MQAEPEATEETEEMETEFDWDKQFDDLFAPDNSLQDDEMSGDSESTDEEGGDDEEDEVLVELDDPVSSARLADSTRV